MTTPEPLLARARALQLHGVVTGPSHSNDMFFLKISGKVVNVQ